MESTVLYMSMQRWLICREMADENKGVSKEMSGLNLKRSSKKIIAQKLNINKARRVQNVNLDYFLNQSYNHKSLNIRLVEKKETSNA